MHPPNFRTVLLSNVSWYQAFYVCSETLERTVFENHTGSWETGKWKQHTALTTEFAASHEGDDIT